jgi:hypothetical protein
MIFELRTTTKRSSGAGFKRPWPSIIKTDGQPQFYGRWGCSTKFPNLMAARRCGSVTAGGCPGIKAVVAYAPEAGAFVAVAFNHDGSAEATVHLLLKALKETK